MVSTSSARARKSRTGLLGFLLGRCDGDGTQDVLYGKKPTVVLSSHRLDLSTVKGATVEQMSGEPSEIVKRFKFRDFKRACIDGGITIQRFLTAGCIDRMTITRVPVLIGAGIPLFGPVPRYSAAPYHNSHPWHGVGAERI